MLQSFHAKLSEKRDLTHDVMLLKFHILETASAVSGQYMIVFVPNGDQPYRRLYSIASDCADLQRFDIVAKIIPGGVASEYFKKLKIDDYVEMQGPAGVYHLERNAKEKLFLATGTGIAPVKAMIHELLARPQSGEENTPVNLMWGLRMYKDVYYLEEFKKMTQANPRFTFKICLSREASLDMIPEADRNHFFLGRVTDLHSQQTKDQSSVDFYLCGDRLVVESLRQYLYEKGFEKKSVIFEKF